MKRSILIFTLTLFLFEISDSQISSSGFIHHFIDEMLPGSSYGTAGFTLADFDKDGDLDITISRREISDGKVFWYENRNGSWVQHDVGISDSRQLGAVTTDINGDGYKDLVMGRYWFENPGVLAQSPDESWKRHTFSGGLSEENHDIGSYDLNNNGKEEILCYSQKHNNGTLRIYYTSDPLNWTFRDVAVNVNLSVSHIDPRKGVHGGFSPNGVGDLDGDEYADIILPGGWYKNPGKNQENEWKFNPWPFRIGITPNLYGIGMKSWVADLNSDGYNDIIYTNCDVEGSQGYWIENIENGREFIIHQLPSPGELTGSFHSLAVADFDFDGDLDILSGEQEDPNKGMKPEGLKPRGFIWENTGTPRKPVFEIRIIHTGNPGWHDAIAGDVDGDGDIDVVSKIWNKDGEYYHVDYWENNLGLSRKNASGQKNILKLRNASQSGRFEIMENTAAGTIAFDKGSGNSRFSWKKPPQTKAGWYYINFPASSIFQIIPERSAELEPFIITITEEGQTETQSSFAFKDMEARPVSLNSLPAPLLNPTLIQRWRSNQPMWIGEQSVIELEVRRSLMVLGDLELEPVPDDKRVRMDLKGKAKYNMFTDEKPICFTYEVENHSGKLIKGIIRFTLKDALDGSEKTKIIPVKIKANGEISEDMTWIPPFGAYTITAELLNEQDEFLCRQHRNLTYSPAIDVKKLPENWPVGYHISSRGSELIPPVGIKWVRIWGGWEEMEPEEGEFNWQYMDEHVAMAKKTGHRLLWACHGVPLWTLPDSLRREPRAFAQYEPANIDRVRPFLREFWQRYASAGVIGAVEIGNEPNAKKGWAPEKYGEMAKAIYEVTKEETKDVRVVGISMSGGTHINYMEQALKAGLNKNMDIASLHLYEIGNPVGDRSIEQKTRLFMQKLQEYDLGDLPVWNTESGVSMRSRQDGVIVPQEELNRQIRQHPDFNPEVPFRIGNNWLGASELRGTGNAIRASFQQFAMGVEKNFMFQWSAGPHYDWVYDWRPGGNVLPKLIVVATGVMSKMLLEFGTKPTKEQPKVDAVGNWLAFAHRFEGPKGRMTIVYIHPSNTYTGSGDQVAALATNDDYKSAKGENILSPWLRTKKPEPVSVLLPVNSGSKYVTVLDMFGRKIDKVEVINGFAEITANEEPQYILESKH